MGRVIRMQMTDVFRLNTSDDCECDAVGDCQCGTSSPTKAYDYYAMTITDADQARREAIRDAFIDSMTSAATRR